MKLLLTGASGRMATAIRPLLLENPSLELVLSSRTEITDLHPRECYKGGDLIDPAVCERAIDGVDGIIHLAGQATEASFEQVLNANIVATQNIFSTAAKGNKPRILFASTYHVTGMYDRNTRLDASSPIRPDSFYGWSKVACEALAQLYWDKCGVESVSVRIGSCFEGLRNERMLSTWLSHADFVRLVWATFSAPEIGAKVIYGMSDNKNAWWSNEDTIGWTPQDSADDIATEEVRQSLTRDKGEEGNYQGGNFATNPLPMD